MAETEEFALDAPVPPARVLSSQAYDQVAEVVVEAIRDERFLILPHPEVGEFFQRKATDYDRWLRGMRRLRARILEER